MTNRNAAHQPIRGQYPGHVITLDQWEASIRVTWSLLTNERPVQMRGIWAARGKLTQDTEPGENSLPQTRKKRFSYSLFIFIFRPFTDHFTAKYCPLQRRDSRKFSQDQKAGLSYELNNDTKVYQQKKNINNSTVISVNNSKCNMYPAFSLNCIMFCMYWMFFAFAFNMLFQNCANFGIKLNSICDDWISKFCEMDPGSI